VAVANAFGRPRNGSIRAAAEAQIRVAVPIAQIVARFVAGLGVVGNFVVAKSARRECIVNRQKSLRRSTIVGERQATTLGELTELRPRLDGQLVTREVCEAELRNRNRLIF